MTSKKVNNSRKFLGSFIILLILLVAFGGFYLGYKKGRVSYIKDQKFGNLITKDVVQLSKDLATSPKNAIPHSNWEWMGMISRNTDGFLQNFIGTTTFKGEVVEASEDKNKWKIYTEDYYVGEEGYYEYGGLITLVSEKGRVQPFLFSPRRMAAVKVYEVSDSGKKPTSFSEIRPGDIVEIEEAVDLAKSNVNDMNLVSLEVRILK